MFKVRIATIAVIVAGLLLSVLSMSLPVPHLNQSAQTIISDEMFHSTLSGYALSITIGVGSALLFLLAISGFSPAFRRTFYFVCAGLMTQALGGMVYLAALFTGTIKSDISLFLAEVALTTGMAVVFIGYVKYSRLLQISSLLTKPVLVVVAYTVVAAAMFFIPHRTDTGIHNELLFDLGHALQAVECLLYIHVGLTVWRIRHNVSKLYARPLLWFMWSVVTAFPPTLALLVEDYTVVSWLKDDSLSILFTANSLLTLISAYSFNKLAHIPSARETTNNTLLDSVIFLSTLVSDPAGIDTALDKVRIITSRAVAGEKLQLTPVEINELKEVYRQLEQYLVAKEPLRSFTVADLSELIEERFNLTSEELKTGSATTLG